MIQKHKAEFNQISLTCEFSGFESYLVCTDEIRLQQVLLNFQSNALKFTQIGGKVTIECIYKPTRPHGTIVISVIDNGVGIRHEDQNKLFKLFGFLDHTKQMNAKGIGLGLFICKKIANKFGGDVSVESVYGQGSKFSFSFELEEKMSHIETVTRTQNAH